MTLTAGRLLATLLAPALALAGCAVAHSPATAASHPATVTAHPSAGAALSPEQRAEADAAAILAAFAAPPGARKLPGPVEDWRELTVEVADAGGGQTAIRVDAQVTWLPARAASEMVPAAAAAITMSVIPDPDLGKKPPLPVTVTSPEAVRRIIGTVNSLPVFPPGRRECGPGGIAALELKFLAAPRGSVLATAYVNIDGCEPVLFAVGAQQITTSTLGNAPGITVLGVPFGGQALAGTALKTAGSKWNLAAYKHAEFS